MSKKKKTTKNRQPQKKKGPLGLILLFFFISLLGGLGYAYHYVWFKAANIIESEYAQFVDKLGRTTITATPKLSGFPGPLTLEIKGEEFTQDFGGLKIENLKIQGWPIPYTPITIETGKLAFSRHNWGTDLTFDSFNGSLIIQADQTLQIHKATLKKEALEADFTGTIDPRQTPVPKLDTLLTVVGVDEFIGSLAQQKMIEDRVAMFLSFGFLNLMDDQGVVRVPLVQRGNKLFAGPIPIADLPQLSLLHKTLTENSGKLYLPEPYNLLVPAQLLSGEYGAF